MTRARILTTCISLGVVMTGCDKPQAELKTVADQPAAIESGLDPGIASRVRKEIGEILGKTPDSIKDTDAFIKDLGADSLDTVEIVMATEEEFDIAIEDEAAEKLITVGDLIEYVSVRLKTAPGSLKKAVPPKNESMFVAPENAPIRIISKFVEVGSRAEELGFDWIEKPFAGQTTVPARF